MLRLENQWLPLLEPSLAQQMGAPGPDWAKGASRRQHWAFSQPHTLVGRGDTVPALDKLQEEGLIPALCLGCVRKFRRRQCLSIGNLRLPSDR